MTSPSTENELMLFRVLERANLTQYYDALISQGGDDLYQLCEAGEEEFLEIMVLVGMSKKPLHVRRLQKALHEWASDPASFNDGDSQKKPTRQPMTAPKGSILAAFLLQNTATCPTSRTNIPLSVEQCIDRPVSVLANDGLSLSTGSFPREHSFHSLQVHLDNNSDSIVNKSSSPVSEYSDHESSMLAFTNSSCDKMTTSPIASGSGVQLHDVHTKKIERTAEEISQGLPYYAPKPLNMKKPIDKEIDEAMNLPEDDPNRMDLFRKYSAIYGRFDSKRRGGKQMNFHERCINEAAAQLCKHRPSLLTRREELFILARQVVREAGFQYSKGFKSKDSLTPSSSEPPPKMLKLDSDKPFNAQDLSFSKFKLVPPIVPLEISVLHVKPDQRGDVSARTDVSDYSITRTQNGNSQSKHRAERTQSKSQQSNSPRKVPSFKYEHSDDNKSTHEQTDEQKEWQREVGLDSLKIAAQHAAQSAQSTSLAQGSSIIQALREGMRGTRSNKISAIIKQELSNEDRV